MTNYDDIPRLSMLSVPARWGELYFAIFFVLCVLGQTFVVCYGVFRPPPDADALDIAANILLRLAAVPIVAALQAFIIMRVRDFSMKTWETFKLERYNKGREDGREEGRVEGREEGREEERAHVIREIRERLARREASARGERDDWLDEILSELSANGGGERRRPRN